MEREHRLIRFRVSMESPPEAPKEKLEEKKTSITPTQEYETDPPRSPAATPTPEPVVPSANAPVQPTPPDADPFTSPQMPDPAPAPAPAPESVPVAAPTKTMQQTFLGKMDTNHDGRIDGDEAGAFMRNAQLKNEFLSMSESDKEALVLQMIMADTSGKLLTNLKDASYRWKGSFHGTVVQSLKDNGLTEPEGRELVRIFRSLRGKGAFELSGITKTEGVNEHPLT